MSSSHLTALHAALERAVLDPKYHDVLMLIKAVRNGLVYGTKVRFPHALVMIFLFRTAPLPTKLRLIFKATRTHARNLALFALLYKGTMLALRQTRAFQKEGPYDAFASGLVGGYFVFGRVRSSLNQQIVTYIFARVMLGLGALAIKPAAEGGLGVVGPEAAEVVRRNAWPCFASLSWAVVMVLFRYHPETLQGSLRSSMTYIYANADHWDSLRNWIWHNK
ncbi:peroxisomal membrane protein 4 [Trichodelitschia bisporula]|uniref:Peroxisomal membrane protein 4 n=1 Tax=Trichodelitschia bisporula TaxID=703511 RepID=A0A6G1I6S1_9PEZI|nr:peroxisomal membrane protein 4 [Trichodelitschia bisporula]